jgi:hypothetical protein
MVPLKKRIPKKGDRVAVRRQHGTFIVSNADSDLMTVALKMVGHNSRLSAIPWGALTFLDERDSCQNADPLGTGSCRR